MTNISKNNRLKYKDYIASLKNLHNDNVNTMMLSEIELELFSKKYGLVWEEHSESVDEILKNYIPIFKDVKNKKISFLDEIPFNFLLEGDNLHSLKLLKKTHKSRIDIIYIDPPYNRGDNDFKYNDDYVEKEDSYKHSKWISFMYRRLILARNLLADDGVIVVNIDENEDSNLIPLMNEIFGENNSLGEIIWNKRNPKGDPKGISVMHEKIISYAKNKSSFLELEDVCMRLKPNAQAMLSKANSLFNKIGKKLIPEDVATAIKPFNYSRESKKDFYVIYTLDLVNKEFKNWLSRQPFSNGEKAYKYIDEEGKVYRGVSMAWPNKKKAPLEYFKPLIHPVTGKYCPIPARGWRNPPSTMKRLEEDGLILFGKDEKKQPERKYFLEENMKEKTPSIYENADSSDALFKKLDIEFEYAKPVSVAKYILKNIHPNPKIILDFFAGSGTTGHAVIELNKEDNGNRKYILCTNNENNICEEVTYKRLKNIQNDLPHNLKYFKTDFIKRFSDNDEMLFHRILDYVPELVELEHATEIDNQKNSIIFEEQDLEKWLESPIEHANLFLSSDLLMNRSQKDIINRHSINVFNIPEYYFRNELKEAGEL